MKKTLIFLALFSTMLGNGFLKKQPIIAKAEEATVDPDNYLLIGAGQTDQAWITKENSERARDTQVRNPIIFFNANPKKEIVEIKRINYRIINEKGKVIDGSVSYDKNFSATFRHMRVVPIWSLPGPGAITWTHNYYEYKNGAFNTLESETGVVKEYAYYASHNTFSFPEMGTTRFISNTLSQFLGEKNEKFPTRLLWEFKTSSTGYKNYEAFNVDKGRPNYKYYLILPLDTVTNVTVEYLSIEAYDADGNLITDKVEVTEDPTPGSQAEKFSFKKVEGKLVTAPAVYFPGSNKFKLVGIQRLNYIDNNEEKDFKVYVFAGDLVGKKVVDLQDGISKEWVLDNSNKRTISYEFFGKNNSLMIDIPTEVTDVTIDIYFERMNTVDGEELRNPFALNLTDMNGDYGIKGELPLEDDPSKNDPWAWLKKLFNFNSGGIFENLKNTMQFILVMGLGIIIIVLVIRLIPPRRRY